VKKNKNRASKKKGIKSSRPKLEKRTQEKTANSEIAEQLHLGRRFMREYREVFEKLAKT